MEVASWIRAEVCLMRDYSWNANNEWKWISIIPDTLARETQWRQLLVVVVPRESIAFVALHQKAAPPVPPEAVL